MSSSNRDSISAQAVSNAHHNCQQFGAQYAPRTDSADWKSAYKSFMRYCGRTSIKRHSDRAALLEAMRVSHAVRGSRMIAQYTCAVRQHCKARSTLQYHIACPRDKENAPERSCSGICSSKRASERDKLEYALGRTYRSTFLHPKQALGDVRGAWMLYHVGGSDCGSVRRDLLNAPEFGSHETRHNIDDSHFCGASVSNGHDPRVTTS